MLCDTADSPADAPVSRFEETFSAENFAGFWEEASYGRLDLSGTEVRGWFTMPQDAAYYTPNGSRLQPELDLDRVSRDCIEASGLVKELPRFGYVMFLVNVHAVTAYGGNYELPGPDGPLRRQVAWIPLPWSWSTIAHEMGHTYGWPEHLYGAGREYNDPWGVMGNTCGPPHVPRPACMPRHPVAAHKVLAGWTRPREVTVRPGERYRGRIERLALPTGEAPLVALIPIRGDEYTVYTVEARLKAGWDRNLLGEGVIIHRVEHLYHTVDFQRTEVVARQPGNYTRADVAATIWSPGEVFADAEALIRITVIERDETGFVVDIENGFPATIEGQLFLPRVLGNPLGGLNDPAQPPLRSR